jgi:hypothetical protein
LNDNGDPAADAAACQRCRRRLAGAVYQVRSGSGTLRRCLRCALVFKPLVARSAAICLVVGTLLTTINQGNVILNGDATAALAWKVPLTYAVPYCVATLGAIMNARSGRSNLQPPTSNL